MTHKIPQREQTLIQLKNIILKTIKDTQINVYLFGSWARKEEKRTSDIDIALKANEDIPAEIMVELRDRIDDSIIPYQVDLVDLTKTNSYFVDKVLKEAIVWRDCSNDSSQPIEL